MRLAVLATISATLALAGCGGDGDGSSLFGAPIAGNDECSATGQKQFVLDAMRDVYFWVDDLPADVDINAFNSPDELLAFLTSFQPLDTFSFINSAEADAAFFGEGQFVGFGFSSSRIASDEIRFTRVFGGSPADLAGIERGQQLLAVDGRSVADIDANEGFGEAFGPAEEGVTRTLTVRNLDGTEFDADITKAVVTIDPVPQVRTFNFNSGTVGYLELATFISTASAPLDAAFADFNRLGITDLIVDLRYNGGGLVSIANDLGDYLGGAVSEGDVFSETLFNAANSASNSREFFDRLNQSMNLSRVVFITTGATASASELVINSMEPEVEVTLVGTPTFGKPVGQVGIVFCEQILRPTAFETVNNLGEGRYFGGLPVDCPVADDVNFAVGSAEDPSTAAALTFLNTGSCPVAASEGGVQKSAAQTAPFQPIARPGSSAQANAYAW
ncbi:MAG: S41 family peptidase [Pseudomonadota bacterium]